MNESRFITAAQIAEELGVSLSYGYKIVRELNAELAARGYFTVSGRVNRQYFYERFYEPNKKEE